MVSGAQYCLSSPICSALTPPTFPEVGTFLNKRLHEAARGRTGTLLQRGESSFVVFIVDFGVLLVMEFEESGIGEECGVFGCVAAGEWPTQLEVAQILTLGLVALQHR